MMRLLALQTALSGLVGFRPHYHNDYPQYAQQLLESRSGLYVNDISLIDPENITAALPRAVAQNAPEWKATLTYRRNSLVRVSSVLYVADSDVATNVHPLFGSPWLQTDLVSYRLRLVMESAITQLLTTLANTQKENGAKTVVEETRLYHGAGSINNRIVKSGRFCGYEIVLKNVRNFALRIQSIGIQVDTPNPALKIYIYHDSQAEPIKVLEPGFTGAGLFSWANVADALLMLDSSAYAPGGCFYVGYYEDDVEGQIIGRETAWPNYGSVLTGFCGGCDPQNRIAIETWSQNAEFHPFTVSEANLNTEKTLWDVNRQNYNYNTNYGLNLNIALECDVTQDITRNELMLADALHKIAQVKCLELFTQTVEDNALAEQCKAAADYQLTNRENYTPGLAKRMQEALKGLSMELVRKGSPCFPEEPVKEFGVSTGTV